MKLVIAFCLSLFSVSALADTYTYTLNALVDFTNINPTVRQNAGLATTEELKLVFVLQNPTNMSTLPDSANYIPDDIEFTMGNRTVKGPGSMSANGGSLASFAVTDLQPGAAYNDGLFFRVEPRADAALPFGELGKLAVHLRFDNDTFKTKKPPEPFDVRQALLPGANNAKVEIQVFRNGLGSGFDFAVGHITDLRLDIQYR